MTQEQITLIGIAITGAVSILGLCVAIANWRLASAARVSPYQSKLYEEQLKVYPAILKCVSEATRFTSYWDVNQRVFKCHGWEEDAGEFMQGQFSQATDACNEAQQKFEESIHLIPDGMVAAYHDWRGKIDECMGNAGDRKEAYTLEIDEAYNKFLEAVRSHSHAGKLSQNTLALIGKARSKTALKPKKNGKPQV